MNTYQINNIKVDIPDSIDEIQLVLRRMLDEEKSLISFINPEIFLMAESEEFLQNYLSSTKFNFVDGIGLLMAINRKIKYSKYTIRDRFPGTDFWLYLSQDITWKVFLLGASYVNNKKAVKNISERYQNVKIVGNLDGYSLKTDKEIIRMINQSNPDILIVCLGVPKQEKWILKNKNSINAKIIFGNGGGIDFWSGNVKRATDFFINHKMEWLFRLFQDFNYRRIKRQLKLIKFFKNIVFNRYHIERI